MACWLPGTVKVIRLNDAVIGRSARQSLSGQISMTIAPSGHGWDLCLLNWRRYAAQCLVMAQRQDRAGDKLALITMAQAWRTLAEQMEKNDAAPEPHEMASNLPPPDKADPH